MLCRRKELLLRKHTQLSLEASGREAAPLTLPKRGSSEAGSSSILASPSEKQMKHDEYYAEDSFTGHVAKGGRVYTGPGLLVGMSLIMGCFVMSTATKKSPNLGFKWLQRRVGAQVVLCVVYVCVCVRARERRGLLVCRWRRRSNGERRARRVCAAAPLACRRGCASAVPPA